MPRSSISRTARRCSSTAAGWWGARSTSVSVSSRRFCPREDGRGSPPSSSAIRIPTISSASRPGSGAPERTRSGTPAKARASTSRGAYAALLDDLRSRGGSRSSTRAISAARALIGGATVDVLAPCPGPNSTAARTTTRSSFACATARARSSSPATPSTPRKLHSPAATCPPTSSRSDITEVGPRRRRHSLRACILASRSSRAACATASDIHSRRRSSTSPTPEFMYSARIATARWW